MERETETGVSVKINLCDPSHSKDFGHTGKVSG